MNSVNRPNVTAENKSYWQNYKRSTPGGDEDLGPCLVHSGSGNHDRALSNPDLSLAGC